MKILERKEEGSANVVICMFLVFIVMICISFSFKIKMVSLTKSNLEDGLTASALASLIVDMEQYSRDGTTIIDCDRSYIAFVETLKTNLNLDEGFFAVNPIYYDKVTVKKFVIYNVKNTDIDVISFSDSGEYIVDKTEDSLGILLSENGVIIEESSVYAELEITIEGFMGADSETVTVNNFTSIKTKQLEDT